MMTVVLALALMGCLFILYGLTTLYGLLRPVPKDPESQPELTMTADEIAPSAPVIDDEDYRRISEGSLPVLVRTPRYRGLLEDSDPKMMSH